MPVNWYVSYLSFKCSFERYEHIIWQQSEKTKIEKRMTWGGWHEDDDEKQKEEYDAKQAQDNQNEN